MMQLRHLGGRALGLIVALAHITMFASSHAESSEQGRLADGIGDGGVGEINTSPPFRWAQRKDRILITIDLQGVTGETFEIGEGGSFLFVGVGAPRDRRDAVSRHRLELQLLKGLNASDSTCEGGCTNWRVDDHVDPTCTVADGSGPWEHCTLSAEVYNMTHCAVRSRDVHCVLIKAKWGGHWPHLLRDNEKPKNMQIDWSKWLDEEKDGVRWNKQVDRQWEWWKHDGEDEEEETEEEIAKREVEQRKQKDKFRRTKKKKGVQSA